MHTKQHLSIPITGSKLKHGIKFTRSSVLELKDRSFSKDTSTDYLLLVLTFNSFLSFFSRKKNTGIRLCL